MTRLDRVIKAFNDYDSLVKSLILWLDEIDGAVAEFGADPHDLSELHIVLYSPDTNVFRNLHRLPHISKGRSEGISTCA